MENENRPTNDFSQVNAVMDKMSHSIVIGVFKETGQIGFLISGGTPPSMLTLLAAALMQEAQQCTSHLFAKPEELRKLMGHEAEVPRVTAADLTGVRETLRMVQGEKAPGLDGSEGPQAVS